ncbi:hypothetical protein [Pseudoalteromonas rhizosphaerae]|uniref:Large polyvalent protein associated domain-containing protein n=2 Tax=Pseudoalteromonas TaxID=53246 RepID=A0ABW8KZF6_9GAMM
MQEYKVSHKQGSSKKHIEFFSPPESADFRAACESAFSKHSFTIEFDGNYLCVTHSDKSSRLSDISIESDEWGVIWGEASQWGSDEENHSAIELFEKILAESGEFIAK